MTIPKLTIVTPSFEGHVRQYEQMVASFSKHCTDVRAVKFVVVVEQRNEKIFREILQSYVQNFEVVFTEDVLISFGVEQSPLEFLDRVGKFTFQTIKKFGGLARITSEWALVLDSECLFLNDFSAAAILENYKEQKYVFYTLTSPRGALWEKSTGYQVNENVGRALSHDASYRWYMEYFHWFYEKSKIDDLLQNKLKGFFSDYVRGKIGGKLDFFENVIYYNYIEKYHYNEYDFVDFKEVIDRYLPKAIADRFRLDELPFSLFGNDYLLNIVSPDEVCHLADLFAAFKLPFVRLEPPLISSKYFPELRKLPHFVATISSHHHVWLNKKIAVCISGEFRHQVHRVPEHQVRSIKAFLSGVDCDIFLHGWSSSSEALIMHELQPKKYIFEERKSFADLAEQIKWREPLIKEKRDQGSLSMLYAMKASFELLEQDLDDYDFVVRLRPDIAYDRSLKEILINMSDNGDVVTDTLYVPRSFNSKGINDQFAIGHIDVMRTYFSTFDYAKENISTVFFNPEYVVLENLLSSGVKICPVYIPYALMRELPFHNQIVRDRLDEQERVWWSGTTEMEDLKDSTEFFREKSKSMKFMMSLGDENKVHIPATLINKSGGRRRALIECRNVDNDPAWHTAAFYKSYLEWKVTHFKLDEGIIYKSSWHRKYAFVYEESSDIVYSEWFLFNGKFLNSKIRVPRKLASGLKVPSDRVKDQAWGKRNACRGAPVHSVANTVEP